MPNKLVMQFFCDLFYLEAWIVLLSGFLFMFVGLGGLAWFQAESFGVSSLSASLIARMTEAFKKPTTINNWKCNKSTITGNFLMYILVLRDCFHGGRIPEMLVWANPRTSAISEVVRRVCVTATTVQSHLNHLYSLFFIMSTCLLR